MTNNAVYGKTTSTSTSDIPSVFDATKGAPAVDITEEAVRAAVTAALEAIAGAEDAAALRSGETGTVMVEVAVDSKGVPTNVSIENRSGNRELDRAALSAVKQWRFQPALRDGKQVASTVMVPVQFELDPASSMASN